MTCSQKLRKHKRDSLALKAKVAIEPIKDIIENFQEGGEIEPNL